MRMNPTERRILLKRAGVRVIKLAEENDITDSAIHQVIDDQRPTQWIREIVAKAVGKPVEKLWPQKKIQNSKFKIQRKAA